MPKVRRESGPRLRERSLDENAGPGKLNPINKRRVMLICLVLMVLTLAAYSHVFKCGFTNYDDDDYVTANQHVQHLTWRNLAWAFNIGYAGNWHPLTWISHMLDCRVFCLNPAGHHTVNLLLHLANTLLLLLVFTRMTRSLWKSADVAALFAVHPLHVESVAWIAERKDVLSTLFFMLTILAYLRYVDKPGLTRYLPVMGLFALGLMAKPMLVTLPFVLLLLDYWPLNRFRRGWRLIWEKLPLVIMAGGSSVLTYLAQQKGGAVSAFEAIPLGVRFSNAAVSYSMYVVKMLWPRHLAAAYPHPRGQAFFAGDHRGGALPRSPDLPGNPSQAQVAMPDLRMAVVSRNADSGYRPDPGRLPGHGGQVYLRATDRTFHSGCLANSSVSANRWAGSRICGHCRIGNHDLGSSRILAGQRDAYEACDLSHP